MAAEFTSNLPAVRKKIDDASRAALVAAALVLVGELKKRVTVKGYTSSKFRNTLLRRNRITYSQPAIENGRWTIRVGVLSGIANPDGGTATVGEIMLSWENGHVNLFTRKYERVEIFRPAAVAMRDQMGREAVRVFRERMAA